MLRTFRITLSRLLVLWVLLAAGTSVAAAQGSAVYSVVTDREPVVSLAGDWRFHAGDDARWADPAFDDSDWELLRSDEPWTTQHPGLSGFAWYRFKVVVPGGAEQYGVLLPEIWATYDGFVDGVKVVATGNGAGSKFFRYPVMQRVGLPANDGAAPRTFVVALRVWASPDFVKSVGGGPVAGALPGRLAKMTVLRKYRADLDVMARFDQVSLLILAGLSLGAALLSMVLYAIRRTELEYLWFGIATLAWGVQDGLTYGRIGQPWSVNAFAAGTGLASIVASLALLLFYRRLLGAKWPWLMWTVAGCTALQAIPFALLAGGRLGSYSGVNLWLWALQLPFELWVLGLVTRRAWARVDIALLLLGPALLLVALDVTSAVLQVFRDQGRPFEFQLSDLALRRPIPVQPSELATLIFLLAMLAALLARFAQTSEKQDRVDQELEAARTLQMVLIPDTPPVTPGLGITTAYHPAQEVGGDFFQILQLAEGETLVVLGDVSGKGVPAAMTVSLVVGAVRTLAEYMGSPGELLAGLNRRLLGRGTGFTTCIALRISPAGAVRMANAGHLQPYLNGREVETDAALPLGLDPTAEYAEQTFTLTTGDRLTLMTDGVVEAQCKGELFGFARTESVSMEGAATIAQAAIGFGQTDDITVLSIYFATGA